MRFAGRLARAGRFSYGSTHHRRVTPSAATTCARLTAINLRGLAGL
jgi:hypothetical protein